MGYCPSVYRAITHCTATGALRDIRAMSLRIIQQRVRERLDATGISMKAASKEVGGETLVRDLLERADLKTDVAVLKATRSPQPNPFDQFDAPPPAK